MDRSPTAERQPLVRRVVEDPVAEPERPIPFRFDERRKDALRHLRYEGYNSHAAFYTTRGLDRVRVYRSFVQQIRAAIGQDAFMLASWGPRPELVGIIDAIRVADSSVESLPPPPPPSITPVRA